MYDEMYSHGRTSSQQATQTYKYTTAHHTTVCFCVEVCVCVCGGGGRMQIGLIPRGFRFVEVSSRAA